MLDDKTLGEQAYMFILIYSVRSWCWSINVSLFVLMWFLMCRCLLQYVLSSSIAALLSSSSSGRCWSSRPNWWIVWSLTKWCQTIPTCFGDWNARCIHSFFLANQICHFFNTYIPVPYCFYMIMPHQQSIAANYWILLAHTRMIQVIHAVQHAFVHIMFG